MESQFTIKDVPDSMVISVEKYLQNKKKPSQNG